MSAEVLQTAPLAPQNQQETPPAAPPPAARRIDLKPRHELLAQLIAKGNTAPEAYRKAYGKKGQSAQTVGKAVTRCLGRAPEIMERVRQLQAQAAEIVLLTINERLSLLARAAKGEVRTASDRSALARVVEVYNKTAGDGAPERNEVTLKGDPAAPLLTVERRETKAERIARLRALRAGRTPPKEGNSHAA